MSLERDPTMDMEDMYPLELFKYAKNGLIALSQARQIERDKFIVALDAIKDGQCYAALELGDIKSFEMYRKVSKIIGKIISKNMHGESFDEAGGPQ